MKNTGIKVLLVLLIVTIALAGYFITTALDRLRESNYHLADTLRNVKTVSIAPAVQESSPRKALKGKASEEALFANKKFFAPEAVTGGRIFAISAACWKPCLPMGISVVPMHILLPPGKSGRP